MKDVNTNWRTSAAGALTATETTDGIEIGAAPYIGHGVMIHVPAQNNAADTLDITFEESATLGGTYRRFADVRPQMTGSGTAAPPIDLPMRIYNTLPFVRCVLTVAGSTPDYGNVHVGLDSGAHRNDLQVGNNNP